MCIVCTHAAYLSQNRASVLCIGIYMTAEKFSISVMVSLPTNVSNCLFIVSSSSRLLSEIGEYCPVIATLYNATHFYNAQYIEHTPTGSTASSYIYSMHTYKLFCAPVCRRSCANNTTHFSGGPFASELLHQRPNHQLKAPKMTSRKSFTGKITSHTVILHIYEHIYTLHFAHIMTLGMGLRAIYLSLICATFNKPMDGQ